MKYLLGYLEGIPGAPSLADPSFQQLLIDVQAGKPQTKSSDAFYDSLEKIVNEIKSSPESIPFHKPVSKRDAPDYSTYISKPMDLSTVLRNVKTHKYKNKSDFAADLDLIWENCLTYNTTSNHPLRTVAKFLQQKANHHLEFLADRDERTGNNALLSMFSSTGAGPSRSSSHQPNQPSQPSALRDSTVPVDDEDAAGESDDAMGEDDGTEKRRDKGQGHGDTNGGATPDIGSSRERRATSSGSTFGERRVNGRANGDLRRSPPPFRPKLQANLDFTPALIRTPYTMTHFQPVSLDSNPGPSFSDKGKAREILYGNAPPPWYPTPITSDGDDAKLEGYWWGVTGKDEAYVAGLPTVPRMVTGPSQRRRMRRGGSPPGPNGQITDGAIIDPPALHSPPPSLVHSKPVSIERIVHRSIDKLSDARKAMNQLQEWQRYEVEGGAPPPPLQLDSKGGEGLRGRAGAEARAVLKRKRRESRAEARQRRKDGGEVGEAEASLTLKRATASMLAHAGFEGANEIALDLLTRVAVDHLRNVGRTFRLLIDGFSHKMNSEEIILHALHENGQIDPQDLEAHIKDDIERDCAKVAEMERKVRQAYKELTSGPVIEDDMLFASDGQMLAHGDFAEDLGEDFLGLRELGIDKEFGLASLSVPRSLFFGRRGRANDLTLGAKADVPDYPPPPAFIPLNPSTLSSHLPALLHAFYAARLESGQGVNTDDAFDPVHAQIGPLGQIVVKAQPGAAAAAKKAAQAKKEATQVNGSASGGGPDGEGGGEGESREPVSAKKKSGKKSANPGIGKGNWIRPSKEERDRRAAEKRAQMERQSITEPPPSEDGAREEDAEGEDE